jgi:hypothetical protein
MTTSWRGYCARQTVSPVGVRLGSGRRGAAPRSSRCPSHRARCTPVTPLRVKARIALRHHEDWARCGRGGRCVFLHQHRTDTEPTGRREMRIRGKCRLVDGDLRGPLPREVAARHEGLAHCADRLEIDARIGGSARVGAGGRRAAAHSTRAGHPRIHKGRLSRPTSGNESNQCHGPQRSSTAAAVECTMTHRSHEIRRSARFHHGFRRRFRRPRSALRPDGRGAVAASAGWGRADKLAPYRGACASTIPSAARRPGPPGSATGT